MMRSGQHKKIALTIGDPAGIGPEVTLKAILSDEVRQICRPLVIGDRAVIEEAAQTLGIPVETDSLDIVDTKEICGSDFEKGRPSARCGKASVTYIRKAVDIAVAGAVDAIVTAPITKESLRLAGFPWPGHTEMLAEFTASRDVAMMLCGGPLRVILATIHAALRDVPALITRERVLRTILHAQQASAMLGIEDPKIAVAGLNPHAGESGLFGDEERTAIAPAVEDARTRGLAVSGPFPADALFHRAYKGSFDIVVCMYHDQGLVPLKMIAFDRGVNVTVGLPIIRTSPDHGTAYDIAWRAAADPSSMIEAIKTATVLRRPRAL